MAQLGYTPGTGAEIKTDQGSTTGDHMQVIKLAEGIAGSENLLPSTVENGLLVEVSRVDGTLSINGPVTIEGTPNVSITASTVIPVTGSVALSGVPTVQGTVTANQGSPQTDANAWPIKISDGAHEAHLTAVGGNYAQDVNIVAAPDPLPVQNQPVTSGRWRQHMTFSASQTGITLHTPASGKTCYVLGFILTPTAAGAIFKLFDNADSDTAELFNGQPPAGCFIQNYPQAYPLSAAGNSLCYSTGGSAAGDLVVWGYDE